MDNSNEFQLMLDKAIKSESLAFKNLDRTKNVQEQLQEMIGDFNKIMDIIAGITIVNQGIIFSSEERRYDWILQGCLSMEQLWLAFVMMTLYYKKWSGTDWIK